MVISSMFKHFSGQKAIPMYTVLSFASPLRKTLHILLGTLNIYKTFLPYLRLGEQKCSVKDFYHLVANVM